MNWGEEEELRPLYREL